MKLNSVVNIVNCQKTAGWKVTDMFGVQLLIIIVGIYGSSHF